MKRQKSYVPTTHHTISIKMLRTCATVASLFPFPVTERKYAAKPIHIMTNARLCMYIKVDTRKCILSPHSEEEHVNKTHI